MTSTYSGQPQFVPTTHESPISQFALQLITTSRDGTTHAMGTAVLIGPGIALTASHPFDVCEHAYGPMREPTGFVMFALQYGSPTESHAFEVHRVFRAGFTDLALLELRGDASWLPRRYPRLNLTIPKQGEYVFAFGYPGTAKTADSASIHVESKGHTTTGQILDVYNQSRDSVRAPFPCFSTNARFDDSMSGGPVFDQYGQLRGVVCSNMPPDNAQGEHYSLVTLLWPLPAMEVDIPWTERPAARYRFYDYLAACGDRVIGLDRVVVADGQTTYRWSDDAV